MSLSMKNLLNVKVSEVKEAAQFPEGNYQFVISGYAEGTNAKSGAYGIAFKIKPVMSLEANDLNNPELADEQRAKLEAFGDWTAKEFCFTYQDKQDKSTHLMGFCPVNFLLMNGDATLHAAASFFYFRDPKTGQGKGFVSEVLGLEFPEETPLAEIVEACINREFIGCMAYEANKDPARRPNLVLKSVSSI